MLSEVFLIPSAYADCISESVSLFASFDYDENMKTVLEIRDIFDGSVIATIRRDFIAPTSGANNIVFLNEDVIYIDYDIIDDYDNRSSKKEIIIFGANSNPVVVSEVNTEI
jgi:hypothetical protein